MSKDCPLSTEHNGPSTRHAVLFDGDCALCNGVARFVGANDPNGRFSLIPLRSPEGEALLAATGGPTAAAHAVEGLLNGHGISRRHTQSPDADRTRLPLTPTLPASRTEPAATQRED